MLPDCNESVDVHSRLSVDGFVVLPDRCGREVVEGLFEASRRALESAQEALGHKEIGIGSAAGYEEIVQRSPGRWDVPIDPDDVGLDDKAMPWWSLVTAVLGADAELWVSGVIASDPGSVDQHWHSDSPHEVAEHRPANVVTVLVALHDISEEMGPTEFARGSHRLTNHLANPSLVVDRLVYQHAGTSPHTLVEGSSSSAPEAWSSPQLAGTCVAFDDRVMHRGMANSSDEVRYVGYFSYRRRGYSTNTYFETQRSVHDGGSARQ